MTIFNSLMIFSFALSLAACQTTSATNCAGWKRNSPAPGTVVYLIKNDRPFAVRVLGNDKFYDQQRCGK